MQIKILSLNFISYKIKEVLSRFPLVILFSFIAAGVEFYLIGKQNPSQSIEKIFYPAFLGIFLSLGLTLYFESKINLSLLKKTFINLSVILLLIGYYFSLKFLLWKNHIFWYLHVIFSVIFLIMISPFLNKNSIIAFWHFNKVIFIRFFEFIFYTAVLFVGFSLILLAVSYLFDIKIDYIVFFRSGLISVFLFPIWYFLLGIPKDYLSLEKLNEYPKILKVISQSILLPLIIIYMLVLYIYLGKIIFTWEMPKGNVGWMVSIFGLVGIFLLCLLYPFMKKIENIWIKLYWKYFCYLMLPLLAMLFLGLSRRISAYGFTENRYYLLLLAFWLSIVVTYFILIKSKNIKFIPLSLAFLSLVTSFGPLSANEISLNSQLNRLKIFLINNKILSNNNIIKLSSTDDIPYYDKEQIRDIFVYLFSRNELSSIENWFTKNKHSLGEIDFTKLKQKKSFEVSSELLKAIGIKLEYDEVLENNKKNIKNFQFNFNNYKENELLNISGYDFILNIYNAKINFNINEIPYYTNFNSELNQIEVVKNGKSILNLSLSSLIQNIIPMYNNKLTHSIPKKYMMIESESDEVKLKIYFDTIYGSFSNGNLIVDSFSGKVLLKVKK